MKKILLSIVALTAFAFSALGAQIVTNDVAAGAHILLASRANVSSIQVISTNSYVVKFYDQNTLTDPYFGTNYVRSAYTGRTTYATNYVTTFTNYLGYINYTTNTGIWTATSSVTALTNELPALVTGITTANALTTYSTDALFTKGVSMYASGRVSVVVEYK